MDEEQCDAAIGRVASAWMAVEGVVGLYRGAAPDGAPVVVVMVRDDVAAVRSRLPERLEAWPVRFELTGDLRAMKGGDPF